MSTIVWAAILAYYLNEQAMEPERAALIMAVYLGMWNALIHAIIHLRD